MKNHSINFSISTKCLQILFIIKHVLRQHHTNSKNHLISIILQKYNINITIHLRKSPVMARIQYPTPTISESILLKGFGLQF